MMEVKATALGIIIYAAMALYLATGVALACRKALTGRILFGLGFLVLAFGFALRWVEVQHAPLQSMFEVFLCLGMVIFPISIFCRRFLRVGGEAADAFIGAIVLFPAGFVFSADPQHLPPALQSPLFVPHVSAYMLSYVILAKAAVPAVAHLVNGAAPRDERLVPYDESVYRLVTLGFPLLTLGLVLGAWWAKLAWDDYWSWDPKELCSLVSWLIYVGYLHYRHVHGKRRPRVGSALAVAGLAAILVTLLVVNLARFLSGPHSYAT